MLSFMRINNGNTQLSDFPFFFFNFQYENNNRNEMFPLYGCSHDNGKFEK